MSADTKRSEAAQGPADPDAPRAREEESDLDRAIAKYGRIGLPVATVVLAGVAGKVQGPPAAVLVLAGGALIAVIALLWASIRTLLGETPLSGADAYALGTPRAEEEQKRAVLRALKDLEFEHGVGKISDEDYRELVAKYRAEAKRLLRQIDDDALPRRAKVEALVNARLVQEGLLAPEAIAPAPKASSEPKPFPKAESPAKAKKGKKGKQAEPEKVGAPTKSEPAEEKMATRVCSACETVNDADAVFCKKCGKRQESEAAEATPNDAEEAS
ncbi:MAG: zinc ribbon domain-containing protein [Byssovorax sp.]